MGGETSIPVGEVLPSAGLSGGEVCGRGIARSVDGSGGDVIGGGIAGWADVFGDGVRGVGLAVIFGSVDGTASLGGLGEVIGPTTTLGGVGFGAGAGMYGCLSPPESDTIGTFLGGGEGVRIPFDSPMN